MAAQIHKLEENKSENDLNTICQLKKLEDLVLSIVQNMMKHKAQVCQSFIVSCIYNLVNERTVGVIPKIVKYGAIPEIPYLLITYVIHSIYNYSFSVNVHFQVSFKSYFEKAEKCNLMEEIQTHCKSIPQTEAAEEIKTVSSTILNAITKMIKQCIQQTSHFRHPLLFWQIIVNLAYDCVSRVYLDCLIKSKSKKLERRWENVETIINQDVLYFHDKFTQLVKIFFIIFFEKAFIGKIKFETVTQLIAKIISQSSMQYLWIMMYSSFIVCFLQNCSVEQNQLLHRMSEVLFCSDKAALELTCATLFKDFPEER